MLEVDKRKFMQEATRLAIEAVENGWGGPFGAVIVRDGVIIGRGQNRVLLTGCPVYHAEVTAIIDASAKLNADARAALEMSQRAPPSTDPVAERARMLQGCEIFITGAPCPMCMSAILWARIDHVYFGCSLEETRNIGFDDALQYDDFAKPWSQHRVPITANFERDTAIAAYDAWLGKQDRRTY